MASERARVGLGVILAAAVAGIVVARSANLRWQDGAQARPYAGDFIHEYSSAWIALHGDAARLYDLGYVHEVQHDRERMGFAWERDSVNVPYYPPPYYALIAPLAWLDYRDAARLWIALQVLAFAGAATLLVRAHPALAPALWWALPGALLFPPLTTALVSGQKSALWLLVFAGTYACLRRGRRATAGAVFGLLVLKPPLALALGAVMLARREGAFAAGAAATGLALAGASLVLGVGVWEGWLRAMLEPVAQDRDALLARATCWLGFSRLALGSYAGAGVVALTLALDALSLAALIPLWRGPLRPGPRLAVAFAAVVLATALISPHLYAYDLTLLLLVFALVGAALAEGAAKAHATGLRRALLALFALAAVATATAHPAAVLASVPGIFALELWLARAAPPP